MLILTVGIVGSGKTFWSKGFVKKNPSIIRLSSDELRGVISGDETNQEVNRIVYNTLEYTTKHLLKQGYTVLIDATNYNKKNRKRFINIARKLKVKVAAYCFNITLERCMERNAGRDRVVPDWVLLKQCNGFEFPDEVDIIYTVDEQGNITKGQEDVEAMEV